MEPKEIQIGLRAAAAIYIIVFAIAFIVLILRLKDAIEIYYAKELPATPHQINAKKP